jgi:hypothetical protein
MQAILMIHSDETAWARLPEAEVGRLMAAYGAYAEALVAAGVMRGGERLHDAATAKRVRVGPAGAEVLDGPYAETREQLGGYFLIEVPDMQAAVEWAARCPGAAHGTIEVRPIWQTPKA